jgi:hypothetical protein
VAVLAAYSGYAAAKWSTESSVLLAEAGHLRGIASHDDLEALITRNIDWTSYNAWFTAWVAHDKRAQQIALNRLRPGYRVAFLAWLATDPAHNLHAPKGPSYMPQYHIPAEHKAAVTNARADATFKKGEDAGGTADEYIRDTVFLATVLFLVGVSGHFPVRGGRYALVGIGIGLLVFSTVQLPGLPSPP